MFSWFPLTSPENDSLPPYIWRTPKSQISNYNLWLLRERERRGYLDGRGREMFGRVRVASSSPDDLERPISKLLKHDSLSIYGTLSLSQCICTSSVFLSLICIYFIEFARFSCLLCLGFCWLQSDSPFKLRNLGLICEVLHSDHSQVVKLFPFKVHIIFFFGQ